MNPMSNDAPAFYMDPYMHLIPKWILYRCYVDPYIDPCINGWSRFQPRDTVHQEIHRRALDFKPTLRAEAVTVLNRQGRRLLSTDPDHPDYKAFAPSSSVPEDAVA